LSEHGVQTIECPPKVFLANSVPGYMYKRLQNVEQMVKKHNPQLPVCGDTTDGELDKIAKTKS